MTLRPSFLSLTGALCILASICAATLFSASLRAQPLPDRAPFSGKVTTATGKPLGGATLLLRRQSEQVAVAYWGGVAATDARGVFSFPDAEAGLYLLSIDAGGYASIQDRTIKLPLEGEAALFPLLELATLLVKVTDTNGAPLKEVPFNILTRGVAGSANGYPAISRGKTDANGDVTFANLRPGAFDIIGVSAGKGYMEAKNTDIKPGKMLEPWVVKLASGGTLSVTARDAAGKPMGGANILFTRVGDVPGTPPNSPGPDMQIYLTRPLFVTRDGDGLFSVQDIAPGRYTVSATYTGAAEVPAQSVEITSGAIGSLDFKFQPPAGFSVTATVTDAKGGAYANSDVIFSLQMTAVAAAAAGAITAAPTENVAAALPRLDRRAHTDGSGAVVLYPVPPGTYDVTVRRANESPGSQKAERRSIGGRQGRNSVGVIQVALSGQSIIC